MNFKVPQFIDVEDKLFGPFTFSEFAYLAGGAGLIFVLYKVLPFFVAILLIIPTGVLVGLLVFYKINNKSFIFYLQAGLTYYMSSKLYIWKQRLATSDDEVKVDAPPVYKKGLEPRMTSNKLRDLSWSLDIQSKQK